MTVYSKTNYKAAKDAVITTNGTGDISGADVSGVFENSADSFMMNNGTTTVSSAVLDGTVQVTGGLIVPADLTGERVATIGSFRYNTTDNNWEGYNGSTWDDFSAFGGDVTKVGTPANDQIGVWTGDGTIEGNTFFTWDGSDLNFDTATDAGAGVLAHQISWESDTGKTMCGIAIRANALAGSSGVDTNMEFNISTSDGVSTALLMGEINRNGTNIDQGDLSLTRGYFEVFNTSDAGAPTADSLRLHSMDSSDTASTLALRCEQTVEAIGTFTASHKHKIYINNVEYWIQLDAV